MELTLWWVEEKQIGDVEWEPTYGPYVSRYKAEEKARKVDGNWLYREPTARINGIIIEGEEAY